MLIVLDTNILVSALLSPFGAPARVLDLVLIGDVQLAYDDRILSEYREVLARPRFGFAAEDVRDLLDYLVATGQPTTAQPLALTMPDPTDLPFLEVAVQAHAPLVTGNASHFQGVAPSAARVLTPAAFMATWRDG
jgi:putative PIN family toxin of toxin-antitoxin system